MGIDLEMRPLKHAVAIQNSRKPPPGNELRYTRMHGKIPPINAAFDELHSSTWYFMGVKRTEGVDDLIEKASITIDPAKRLALLNQVEKLAYEDAMFITYFTEPAINVHVPELKDVMWYNGRSVTIFTSAWLDK